MKLKPYYRTNNGALYHGDCLDIMPGLEKVDMVLTSPPYDKLRTYENGLEWSEHIWKQVIQGLYNITKEGGVVVWVVNDATIKGSETGTSFKQALYFKECGFNLHDTMIYQKYSNPFPNINRYYQTFEYMFIFSKGKLKTANLIKDKLNKNYGSTLRGHARKKDGSIRKKRPGQFIKKYSVRPNIWLYGAGNNQSTKDKIAFEHPAIFPEKLAEDHILSWSNENDLILDPFSGSGTTFKMSEKNNRRFIGIEKIEKYCKITTKRIRSHPYDINFY